MSQIEQLRGASLSELFRRQRDSFSGKIVLPPSQPQKQAFVYSESNVSSIQRLR